LGAGVDTTHHVLLWLMLHLSANPDKQEILRKELQTVLGDGPVTGDHLRNLPYLNLVIRESHRLAPLSAFSNFRRLPQDSEIGGYVIPKEVKVTFCLNYIQKDPAFVSEPEKFIPERWRPEAVEKRKGTPSEILDHKLLKNPFGFGPRMCLGSRVAEAELKVLLARLVRDWRFVQSPPNQKHGVLQGTLLKPNPFPTLKWEKVTR